MKNSIFIKRKIVLGITGSIAAYKAAYICSKLVKLGSEVIPVMTSSATNFINPITFSSLSGKKTIIGQFENEEKIYHIDLAHSADAVLIAPATINIISKLSSSIGDDFLSTMALAALCPILIAPAANESMYLNPQVQENISSLKESGKFFFVGPKEGDLACGEKGIGRLEEEEMIIEELGGLLHFSKDLKGKTVMISAGGTKEFIDPVRYISNRSSGKMGYCLAEEAYFRGARKVILVSATRQLPRPYGVQLEYADNTASMKEAMSKHWEKCDIAIMAAAVSDIIPGKRFDYKIKKKDDILSKLSFIENENILSILGQSKKAGQVLVGFAAESIYNTSDILKKMSGRNIDMMVANDISRDDIGMESQYNEVEVVKSDGSAIKLIKNKKRIISRGIWDEIIKNYFKN